MPFDRLWFAFWLGVLLAFAGYSLILLAVLILLRAV